MIYLIEPYNAYQKPPRKRHWTEEAEEEALFYSIMEANRQAQKTSLNNQNEALPQYQAQPAQQQNTQTACAPAGGGGQPSVNWFNEQLSASNALLETEETAAFSLSPDVGVGPSTVTFTNLSRTPEDDTFLWIFGSGSKTSTLASPPPLTYTAIGNYTVTLQMTSSAGHMSSMTLPTTASTPTLTAGLTTPVLTGSAPFTVPFTSTTIYNGAGTLIYKWDFGSGSATSTQQNPTVTYTNAGTYTVSLQVTESYYGLKNKGTRSNYIQVT